MCGFLTPNDELRPSPGHAYEMGGESGDLVAQTLGWDGRNLLGEKENKNPVELRHF